MSETLKLTILNRQDELNRIATEVEALGEREEWPPELVFRANLILEELGLNIINYGYDDGVHEIEIILNSEQDYLRIEIMDDGKAFDPTEDAPDPSLAAPLDERPIGGLGVYLVRSMVDEFRYKREDGKNHVALVTRRDR